MPPFKVVTAKAFAEKSNRSHRRNGHVQRSCVQCRTAKLRCDRGIPCRQCVSSGHSTACRYNSSIAPPELTGVQPELTGAPAELIGRQEDLIGDRGRKEGQYATGSPRFSAPGCSSESVSTSQQTMERVAGTPEVQILPHVHCYSKDGPSIDHLIYSSRGTLISNASDNNFAHGRYLGSTHWAIFVSEFLEVRQYLERDPVFHESWQYLSQISRLYHELRHGPDNGLWHGRVQDVTKYLLDILPPKPICDILVENFWATVGQIMPFVHRDTFFQRYAHFNRDDTIDTIWLLQFTVILSLGYICDVSTNGLGRTSLASKQSKGSSLLTAVEMVVLTHEGLRKPSLGLLEVFLLIFIAKYMLTEVDGPNGMCAILGVMQKMAFTLGLHRDPLAFNSKKKLSSEEVERRRQLWAIYRVMDYEYSIQNGVPHTVRDDQCDCRLPAEFVVTPGDTRIREEDFNLSCFISLARLTARAASMEQNISQRARSRQSFEHTPSSEIQAADEMQLFKSALDEEISRLTKLWISSNMPRTFAFYHFLFDILWHRTTMLRYQCDLSQKPDQCYMSWPPFIRAALAILIAYRDFARSQGGVSDSWWNFYQSFIKYDIYRASLGLCYAVTRMIRDHLNAPERIMNRTVSGTGGGSRIHQTPTFLSSDISPLPNIHSIIETVEITRDLWTRNIVLGINYVKGFQILSMVLARTKSDLENTNGLKEVCLEAGRCLKLAQNVLQSSKSRSETTAAAPYFLTNTGELPQNALNATSVSTFSTTPTGEATDTSGAPFNDLKSYRQDDFHWPSSEAGEDIIDWDWFDQLLRS